MTFMHQYGVAMTVPQYKSYTQCMNVCRLDRRVKDTQYNPRALTTSIPFHVGTQWMHEPEPRVYQRLREDKYCQEVCTGFVV